jgi:ABC-2 type transport system permease protein
MSTLNVWSANALLIKQLGILYHYEALSKGLIDSRDVIYFISVGALMLLISKIILSARSW